jgi:hypothetical protein
LWPAGSTRSFTLGFLNGALTQPPPPLRAELYAAGPLGAAGGAWECGAGGDGCREPTAEAVAYAPAEAAAALEAAAVAVAVAGGAESAAAAATAAAAAAAPVASTAGLSLVLWMELVAEQATPVPGDANLIRLRMRPSAALAAGDVVVVAGLTGFATPNAPAVACDTATVLRPPASRSARVS